MGPRLLVGSFSGMAGTLFSEIPAGPDHSSSPGYLGSPSRPSPGCLWSPLWSFSKMTGVPTTVLLQDDWGPHHGPSPSHPVGPTWSVSKTPSVPIMVLLWEVWGCSFCKIPRRDRSPEGLACLSQSSWMTRSPLWPFSKRPGVSLKALLLAARDPQLPLFPGRVGWEHRGLSQVQDGDSPQPQPSPGCPWCPPFSTLSTVPCCDPSLGRPQPLAGMASASSHGPALGHLQSLVVALHWDIRCPPSQGHHCIPFFSEVL